MSLKVLVLGALSAVGEATARLYAQEGASLLLVGRDEAQLARVAADLRVRGAKKAEFAILDLAAVDAAIIDSSLRDWVGRLGGLDHVILAYGALGDQTTLAADLDASGRLIDVNFRSAALWCLGVSNELEARRGGALVVLGSVAGDRGRQSNYLYGATKAGLAALVQGLAHRLSVVGARAVIVKPGFIDSPMTAHIAKSGPLWSTPAQIAAIVRKAASRGGPVVYAPGFWRIIMLAIRLTPASIFHKTRL